MAMSITSQLKNEIASFKKEYEKLKDFLVGAEYDINDVRACLHEIKDRISRINILLGLYLMEKGQKPITIIPTDELISKIDLALMLIEMYPKETRLAVQTALGLSKVKIENVAAFLDLLVSNL
jgi:archaellum component FlaC